MYVLVDNDKFIVCGDNHLRLDLPTCRMDTDWLGFQEKVLADVVRIANKNDADLVIPGDLFDTPRVHSEVVSMFIRVISTLNRKCHIIGGNHSLPYHREANINESSLGSLLAVSEYTDKIVYHLSKEECIEGRFQHSVQLNDSITLVHTLTFETEDDIPYACNAITAQDLLNQYDTTWVFVGDMHKSFHYENNGRHVVNSGCMTIQSANEIGYSPSVYFVDTSDGAVKKIPIHNEPDMLTRDHIEARMERDSRLNKVLEVLTKNGEVVTISFMSALTDILSKQKNPVFVDTILEEIKEEITDGK